MFRDIFGRDVNDGDICITMPIGRNSRGMRLGIAKGKSVLIDSNYSTANFFEEDWDDFWISSSSSSNVYLVENPSKEELLYIDKLRMAIEDSPHCESGLLEMSSLEVGCVYGVIETSSSNKTIHSTIYLGDMQVYDKTEGCTDDNCLTKSGDNLFLSFTYSHKFSHALRVVNFDTFDDVLEYKRGVYKPFFGLSKKTKIKFKSISDKLFEIPESFTISLRNGSEFVFRKKN